MKKGTISKLLAVGVFAVAASGAQAQAIDTWVYTLELSWITSSTEFNAGRNVSGYTGSEVNSDILLSWGAAGANYKNVNANDGFNRSALEITNQTSKGIVGVDGTPVFANLFTHYNAPIWDVYPSLERAELSVSIQLALPGSGAVYTLPPTSFDVYFKETPNTGLQCGWGLCDDDIFAIVATDTSLKDFSRSFVHDGYEYTFNYFEASNHLNDLSATVCGEVGIASGIACYGFTTPENAATAVSFSFSMTATPVPEPETYAMLLAGLGLVGMVSRRRRNK